MKKKKHLSIVMLLAMTSFLIYPVKAQDSKKTQDSKKASYEIEVAQDKIEDLYVKVYNIMESNPDVTYDYVYEDGSVMRVNIEGALDAGDKTQLQTLLIDLEKLKKDIFNLTNRVGVYYVTETEPKPKMGYDEFYEKLHSNLTFPESAKDQGVEGSIFVKFVVDQDGNVENVIASEDIDAPGEWIVKDLKKEAKKAVKATSGDWIPAQVGGVPVSKWMVLPVQFKLESPLYRPLW